jgi:ribose transport system substrate-binding protein
MNCSIRKRIAGMLLLVLCLICNTLSACGIGGAETGDRSKIYVAIVAKSTTSAYWKTTFAGARAASAEYNLEISIEGPENEEDYETQNQMIHTAVENGAKAI